MLNPRQPIEEIDALLRERVVELVADITGTQPNKLLSRKGEARFGSKGGIAVTTAGKDKGRITLFDGDGKGRSPFQFIQYELNLEFSAAVSWASNWLGLDNAYRPNPVAQELANQKRDTERAAAEIAEQQDRQKKIDTAVELAGCSLPAARTDGEAYLRRRAITASLPDCVRYIPAPSALLMVATSPSDSIQAVQRIFLDGDCKANIVPNKRTNGPLKNAAVRLPGDGHRLYLAEGPETALSVWQSTGAPTWAVLGQNFRDHEIPGTITEIVIAADNDAVGSTAYQQTIKSAEHYQQRGYAVFIARPDGTPKCDFNDIHQSHGEVAVRSILQMANCSNSPPAMYQPPTGTIEEAREGVSAFVSEWVDKVLDYRKRKAEFDASR
jgi:hypothetical protein